MTRKDTRFSPESGTGERPWTSLPVKVIACPHCRGLSRLEISRWGTPDWDLYSDQARVSRSSAEFRPIARCPGCRKCFWRDEAVTMGYLGSEPPDQSRELFGVERIPPVEVPEAADLELGLIEGLPRSRHDIWRIHLMAWQRLNDDLRFEPCSTESATAFDDPIRATIANALLKDLPNRHVLTLLLEVDVRRQMGQFRDARELARSLKIRLARESVRSGDFDPGKGAEPLAFADIEFYDGLLRHQIDLIHRRDRLPRRHELPENQKILYHSREIDARTRKGRDERLRPMIDAQGLLWQRVQLSGWKCHNCGRDGRAGEEFAFAGQVVCRHCGWPQ